MPTIVFCIYLYFVSGLLTLIRSLPADMAMGGMKRGKTVGRKTLMQCTHVIKFYIIFIQTHM